jgi:DNA replication protein DnaC
VLTGAFGSGKTHLAAAIALYRQQHGYDVMFVTMSDLLDHLRITFAPNSTVTFDGRFNQVRTAPLLVLDSLSLDNASSWAKDKLFQILDHRFVARLPTVITTSQEIENIDERLATRLLDRDRCTVFGIKAPAYSYRNKKRRE